MLFLISIAFATPSDLPSGECATDGNTTPFNDLERNSMKLTVQLVTKQTVLERKDSFLLSIGTPWVESSAALTEVLLRRRLWYHLCKW